MPRLDVLVYRLMRGGPSASINLLLTARGRKTGKERTVRLRYFRDGETYLIIGSNSGSDHMPGWYHNLKATPDVQAQVGARRFRARAETLAGDEREQVWQRVIADTPGFASMQQRTSRIFPIVRLTPSSEGQ